MRDSKGRFVKGSKDHNMDGLKFGHGWNKGLKGWTNSGSFRVGHKLSEKSLEKLKNSLKGRISPRKGVKLTEETKRKISENLRGHIPWNRGLKGYMAGEKHPFYGKKRPEVSGEKSNLWKGGISKTSRKERANFMDTPEYKKWRRNVFKRDDYTCQICGCRGGIVLRANHIKKYSDYPELRVNENNGITICRNCDIKWVLNHESEWESYFNFNLATRGILEDEYILGYTIGQNL